jgi:hypothetical protein
MMVKETVTMNIDSIKNYKPYLRIRKYNSNPEFVDNGYIKYEAYPDPMVVFEKGSYYLVGNGHVLDLAIKKGLQEIRVNIVKATEDDVLKAMLCLDYHNQKQYRSMAEQISMLNEQIAANGSSWLYEMTGTHNKNEQISIITGISISSVKYYQRIVQNKDKKFLNNLSRKYGPKQAYNDICAEEKKAELEEDKDNEDKGNNQSEVKVISSAPVKPTASVTEPTGEKKTKVVVSAKPTVVVIDPTGEDIVANPEAFPEYLNNFKNTSVETTTNTAIDLSKCCVWISIPGDSILKFPKGYLDIKIGGTALVSTEQLVHETDGTWGIKDTDDVKLTLQIEVDFFRDF